MQYLSSYYWQQEKYALTSMVLQQLVYRRGKVPVLFACICEGKELQALESSRYLTQQLTEWFQSRQQKLVKRVEERGEGKLFDEIECEFREKMKQIDREIAAHKGFQEKVSETSIVGLLCVGNRFWLFGRGGMSAYLLNTRFGQVHCEKLLDKGLPEQEELTVVTGLMEADIGLLVASDEFSAKLTEAEMRDCLAVREMRSQEQGKRRLEELGAAAERRGGQHMGAVLLVTR